MDEDLIKRIEMFNKQRDNRGCFVVDKETEEFGNVQATITGMGELQEQALEHLAAVYRIPLVKLTGISPSGLNASSEGEIRVYYDLIHATQEYLIKPPIQTIFDLAQIELWGDVDPDITFEFVKLYEMTEVEAAQVRSTEATTDGLLIDKGVISPEEVAAQDRRGPGHALRRFGPFQPARAAASGGR
jgi:uncharacterized protein